MRFNGFYSQIGTIYHTGGLNRLQGKIEGYNMKNIKYNLFNGLTTEQHQVIFENEQHYSRRYLNVIRLKQLPIIRVQRGNNSLEFKIEEIELLIDLLERCRETYESNQRTNHRT